MADRQIEEVKQKSDIVAVISERVKLSKSGRNFKGLCPFHSEKTPSFYVSAEMQIYKCFGCGEAGDLLDFLEKFEGMEFVEALEYLAERAGVKLVRGFGGGEKSEREKWLEINHLAAEFYHFLLTEHRVGEGARAYLKNRGVNREVIKVFQLGYAPKSWEGVEDFLVRKKGYRAEDLEKVGLVIRGDRGYYDRFRGRVMFPLTDARGKVMGFAGRVLDVEVKQAKYINTPETQLYHKSELLYGLSVTKAEIKKQDWAVVVEGEVDVISSWKAGVKNVVAIKGSAFTEEQIRLLLRYCRQARLALDADAAGQEATKRSIALADRLGLSVRVVKIAGGKDPDEIANKQASLWREMVKQAVGVYDFYVESALLRFDVKTGEGKRGLSMELAPILAAMGNQVEQAHYVKVVAEALGVSEEAVMGEMRKSGLPVDQYTSKSGDQKDQEKTKTRGEMLEEYWLGIVLRANDEVRREAVERVKDKVWEASGVGRVVGELKADVNKSKKWEVTEFADSLGAELRGIVARVWLTETEEDEDREEELKRVESGLEKLAYQDQLKTISGQIRQIEAGGKQMDKAVKGKLNQLRQEFVKISVAMKRSTS